MHSEENKNTPTPIDDDDDDIFAAGGGARQTLLERSGLLMPPSSSAAAVNAVASPLSMGNGAAADDLFGGLDIAQEEEEEEDMPFVDAVAGEEDPLSFHAVKVEEDPLLAVDAVSEEVAAGGQVNSANVVSKGDVVEKQQQQQQESNGNLSATYRNHSSYMTSNVPYAVNSNFATGPVTAPTMTTASTNMNANPSTVQPQPVVMHRSGWSHNPNMTPHASLSQSYIQNHESQQQQQQQQQVQHQLQQPQFMNTPSYPAKATSNTSSISQVTGIGQGPSQVKYGQQQHQASPMALDLPLSMQKMGINNYEIPLPELKELPPPKFKSVNVRNPILIHNGGGFLGSKFYWSFEVISEFNYDNYKGDTPTEFLGSDGQKRQATSVRRRFRHFCALEERLRGSTMCAGSILPPRPHKHTFEEAGQNQTEEFAIQRASELDEYMTLLARHPKAGHTDEFTLFLTLSDDIGTAWPDVSVNALTRLTEGTQNLVKTITGEGANGENDLYHGEGGAEDDATLLALGCQESLRIGVVSQAVPKLEGAVMLLKEHSERVGNVGMELNRVIVNSNSVQRNMHKQLKLGATKEIETFSGAMIKSGRRSKRMAVETAAALKPFVFQKRACPSIRNAFTDRRQVLGKKAELRDIADEKAHRLLSLQYQMNAPNQMSSVGSGGAMSNPGMSNPYSTDSYANSFAALQAELEKMEMEAALGDEEANAAAIQAQETGSFLKEEVARLALQRKDEWIASMKILAESMREASADRKEVWETAGLSLRSIS